MLSEREVISTLDMVRNVGSASAACALESLRALDFDGIARQLPQYKFYRKGAGRC